MNAAQKALEEVAIANNLNVEEFIESANTPQVETNIVEEDEPEATIQFAHADKLPSVSIAKLRSEERRLVSNGGRAGRRDKRYQAKKQKKEPVVLPPLKMIESVLEKRNINGTREI